MLYFVFVVHPALGYCSVDPAVLDGYFGFVFLPNVDVDFIRQKNKNVKFDLRNHHIQPVGRV